MEEFDARNYRWYLRGCFKLEWTPVNETEFCTQYGRYRRCNRALQRYEHRRTRHLNRRGLSYRDDVFLERLIRKIRDEYEQLNYLETAISSGLSRGNDQGGAGMPAYRLPDTPVLVGAGAKLPPHLDPEPWARDP